MLTRREVLMELRRLGMGTPSSLKISLREFERYMGIHHGLKIVKTKKRLHCPSKLTRVMKIHLPFFLSEIHNEMVFDRSNTRQINQIITAKILYLHQANLKKIEDFYCA